MSPRLSDADIALLSNPLLIGAMEWAVRGFPVFRLAPGDKVPLAGSQGLLDATTELATIEQWWTETPDANIGVRMDGHLAVDADTDVPELRQTLRLWFENGWPLPPTLTQLTGRHHGRRGFHLIYQAPEDVRFKSKPWPGIDLKCGTSGYIVGAPSRHPSGVHYELVWKPPLPEPSIAQAPPWLVEHARKPDPSTTSSPGPSIDLDAVFRGLGKGARDEMAYKLACRYRGLGLAEQEALVLVGEWWRRMEQPPDDPFPWEAAQEKVHRAYIQHQSEFEKEVIKGLFWESVRTEVRRRARAEEETASAPPPSPLTLAEELAQTDDEGPLAWMADSILAEGHNVSLTGEYKTGKTTQAAINLPKSLVDGKRFLGVFDTHLTEGRVGIWNYEVTPRQFRLWLREASIAHPERVSVLHLRGHRLDMLTDAGQRWAVEWLAEREVRVWVLDPWALVMSDAGLEENDNTGAARLTRALDRIKERAGVSVMLVTQHTGRKDKERARGATRLDDWADTRWLLVREEGDGEERRYFRTLPSRDVESSEWQLGYQPGMRKLQVVGPSRRLSAAEQRQHHLLSAINNTPGIQSRELRLAVGGDNNKLTEEVRALSEKGLVVTEQGPPPGRPTLHYLTDLGRARLAEQEGRLL